MKTNAILLLIFSLFINSWPVCAADQAGIMIHEAWINQVPPGATVTAGYLMIHNTGSTDIVLKQASSADFARVELHRSVIADGIARMEKLDEVTIPANSGLTFKPGDYHLMLFEPRRQLAVGDRIGLSLQFSNSVTVETMATVRQTGSGPDDHSQHH
jgi:hypothetical protein